MRCSAARRSPRTAATSTSTPVALEWPPADGPAVFVGAVGPRTLRLSGAGADGTILTGGTSVERVREARALIAEGRTGREQPHPVVVYLHAAIGPGAVERLEAERNRFGYDSMDDVGVAGDAQAVAAAVRRWAEAGADTVVLQPTADDPDPEGFMRFVGRDVREALGG